jgi:hypothetical protein
MMLSVVVWCSDGRAEVKELWGYGFQLFDWCCVETDANHLRPAFSVVPLSQSEWIPRNIFHGKGKCEQLTILGYLIVVWTYAKLYSMRDHIFLQGMILVIKLLLVMWYLKLVALGHLESAVSACLIYIIFI